MELLPMTDETLAAKRKPPIEDPSDPFQPLSLQHHRTPRITVGKRQNETCAGSIMSAVHDVKRYRQTISRNISHMSCISVLRESSEVLPNTTGSTWTESTTSNGVIWELGQIQLV